MSLEAAIEKLADAILAHADALKLSATTSITVSAADVSAVKEVLDKPSTTKADKADKADKPAETKKADEKGPFYWADNTTGHFGKVDTKAEYNAKKKENDNLYLIPETIYSEKLAELKAKNEPVAAAAKRAEAAAKRAEEEEAAAAAKRAEEDDLLGDGGDDAIHVPTAEEYKGIWERFLGVDDGDLRTERLGWARQVIQHFGAKKATLIAEENWPVVYKAVKAALEDEQYADPTSL